MSVNKKTFKDKVVFVDFHGYQDPSETVIIKEFYILSLDLDDFGNIIDKHFVYKDTRNIARWPEKYSRNLFYYLKRYRIPLKHGKNVIDKQRTYLRQYLKHAEKIYVDTTRKAAVLHALLGNDLNVISLMRLGYEIKDGEYICDWHEVPEDDSEGIRCSKGRAVAMGLWYAAFNQKKRKPSVESSSSSDESRLPFKKRKTVRTSSSEEEFD